MGGPQSPPNFLFIYSFSLTMSIAFVYVIAFDHDGRFIMVKHVDRAWEMPGGRIEEGETPREAGIREFLEETGMEVEQITSPDDNLQAVFDYLIGH